MAPDSLLRSETALDRLAGLHPKLIDFGLERTFRLLDKLGNPHLRMPPVIHLAGTNGKGSTLAFLRAMLEAGGHTVHAYTSPHLVRFHERIRLAGDLIGDGELADLLEEVETVNDNEPATFFEVTTAAAMLAFARHEAEFTLLETGLGGRLDSTNVVPGPLATVITPIAHDHERFLGDSLESIAREKAGIMRSGVPCFCSLQSSPEVLAVFEEESRRLAAPLAVAGRDFGIGRTQEGVRVDSGGRSITIPRIGLNGHHQFENAAAAAAVLMAVAPGLGDQAIITGAGEAKWPGRVEPLPEGVLTAIAGEGIAVWLDGAHNAHGAAALARSLGDMGAKPWVAIIGALDTRPPEAFLEPLAPLLAHAVSLTIPGSDASLSAEQMAKAAGGVGIASETASDITEAMEKAAAVARRQQANIVISGSLYLAGYALDANGTPPE